MPNANFFQKSYQMDLFNGLSSSYEGMNYLTSFGFSHLWRKQFLQPLQEKAGRVQVADLMTGMGETWSHVRAKWPGAQICGLDFSEGMLRHAANRNKRHFESQVELRQEDVFQNSLPAGSVDVVTCAFGLKTLDPKQLAALAQETKRLLKPDGQFAFVEISEPAPILLRVLYLFYLNSLIPLLGLLFARDYGHYKMLGYYTQAFRNSSRAAQVFKEAGLQVITTSYFNGCASGFYGQKVAVSLKRKMIKVKIRQTSRSTVPDFSPAATQQMKEFSLQP